MPRTFFSSFLSSATAGACLMLSHASTALAAVGPGEILISEMNCVACHDAEGPIKARLSSRPSPKLDRGHAVKLSPQWIQSFLENPQAVQPGTLMPDLLAGYEPASRVEAAEALTQFLVELRGGIEPPSGDSSAGSVQKGRQIYHTVGCVACHAPQDLPSAITDSEEARAEFETLRTASIPFGALGIKYDLEALSGFLRDPLKSRSGGRMPSLKLNESEARSVAAYLLEERPPSAPHTSASFVRDPAKVQRGKELYTSLNCAACHEVENPGRKSKPLAALNARQPAGCLGTRPKPGVPKFELTDRQRVVILTQLGNQPALHEPLSAEQQITRTMTALNCFACHSRGRRGGAEGLRREYFTGPAELGEQGRIPPTLREVGTRLRSEQLKAILLDGQVTRPTMPTRMPLYGNENVSHLPDLFRQADSAVIPPSSASSSQTTPTK